MLPHINLPWLAGGCLSVGFHRMQADVFGGSLIRHQMTLDLHLSRRSGRVIGRSRASSPPLGGDFLGAIADEGRLTLGLGSRLRAGAVIDPDQRRTDLDGLAFGDQQSFNLACIR